MLHTGCIRIITISSLPADVKAFRGEEDIYNIISPQTNGQVERLNRYIATALPAYVKDHQECQRDVHDFGLHITKDMQEAYQ